MERTPYRIPRMDLTEGQIIRTADGTPSTITQIRYDSAGRPLGLVTSRNSVRVTIRMGYDRRHLSTWLTPAQADQPGMDPATGRCATCDGHYCQDACSRPWVADVAL